VTAARTRVLLVEDNALVRSTLLQVLEVGGFEAIGAGDAAETLEVLGQHRVDVVVADYHLPGITGLELLAAIRGSAPGTGLILYSGGMTDTMVADAADFGVHVVMEKPVSSERLVEAVRAAVPSPSRPTPPSPGPAPP
jgi:DNA-binding NtrC family response regulator